MKSCEDEVMKNIILVAFVAILGVLLADAVQAESIKAVVDSDCYPSPGTLNRSGRANRNKFCVAGS